MQYCTRCLYPANHPLYITFDAEGVCSGCRIHEEKDILDWAERLNKLKKIAAEYKVKTRSIHDCVIPVNGARDSYFIVHVVKNILGLNPLLVTYNKHYNTNLGIRNLAYLRSILGCDILTMTVSPERIKRITRASLENRGSMYWHCLAGQTVFPVQIAVKFKIPLIIWGAHQGVDQVGMYSHLDEVEMTRKYRKEHDLMSLEAEDLLKNSTNITSADIEQFIYPHDKEIESVGVRGIYLNNYIRWDTKAQHELMIKMYHYETMKQQRTFDTYNDVDCFHYSSLHDYIKFLKWGYGKVTDHASREIRLKRMTREEGLEHLKQYNSVKPIADLQLFLDWIEMNESEFWPIIDKFRDQRVWGKDLEDKWQLKDSILNHNFPEDDRINAVRLTKKENCNFILTPSKDVSIKDNTYDLIGRGWVDKCSA
ncbi:MAG: N-acetyl sugar amidotransferase [Gammaproteobacteria bacterium]|nr:N-acetyl sugar amidotransferase [Gammaproteobacteria bacterium]